MNWIVALEEENYSIRADSYQRLIADLMFSTINRLDSLKHELIVEENKFNYSLHLQKIRKDPSWVNYYFPVVTIHRSRLDQKRDKNRKIKIVNLKKEIKALEEKLRDFNVPST